MLVVEEPGRARRNRRRQLHIPLLRFFFFPFVSSFRLVLGWLKKYYKRVVFVLCLGVFFLVVQAPTTTLATSPFLPWPMPFLSSPPLLSQKARQKADRPPLCAGYAKAFFNKQNSPV